MEYKFVVTAWGNGSPKGLSEFKNKASALKFVAKSIARPDVDAIDVCKVTVGEGYLHSKECWTYLNGKWEYSESYVGEDEYAK